MSFRSQMPYLGKRQEDGSLQIGEHIKIDISDWFSFRPDYKKFKSKEFQSEAACVAILTGISCFEECEAEMFEIEQMAIKEISMKDNVSLLSPIVKEWEEFTGIKRSLKELIEHGKVSGRINDHYAIEDEDEIFLYDSRTFKPYSYLNALQFLKWAQSNNFKIPDELKFGEHENGTLYWIENEGSAGVATTENDIEKQLDQELQKICPEVEKFYNALKEEVDIAGTSSNSINAIEQSELHQLATDYYDRKKNEYKYLTRELINGENIYTRSETRRRVLIGTVLQRYLKLQSHPAMDRKKANISRDSLRKRHNKIIKYL